MGQCSKTVVGIGEVLWDVFDSSTTLGGAPTNFACIAAALGSNACVVSSVGSDDLGNSALTVLQRKNVDTSFVTKVSSAATGRVDVWLNELGQPDFEIHADAAWDYIPWSDNLKPLAMKSDAVCFGTLAQRSPTSRETIQRFLNATRSGCSRILDINLRQPFYDDKLIAKSLDLANVLKLNEQELSIVCSIAKIDNNEPKSALLELSNTFNLNMIMLTEGSAGSTLLHENEFVVYRPKKHVDVRDCVGAGDAFAATAVIGLLNGWPIHRMNSVANQVASYVCTQPGATPQLPRHLLELFKSG